MLEGARKVEFLADTTSAATLISDIPAFGSGRRKASCEWYFCTAVTLRDWQGLGSKMNRASYQSLEFPGIVRKGSLGSVVRRAIFEFRKIPLL